MSLTGEPDREPLKPYGNQAEAQAAFHVLAAVLESQLRWMRSRTASVVDISVQEVQASALEFQGPMAFNRQLFPGVSSRTGNNVRTLWSQYRCQDGWVGVFINPPNLKAFFTLIGHPEMLERLTDEEFLNGELRELVTNWCAARTKQEVFDAAVEFGAPLSYVAAPADVLASETIAATGFWRDVEHPGHGPIRVPGSPFSSTEMSFQLTAAAPPISQGAK
jgi:crotonobetainyl-CoA:carnitine CoA-transferase CaiB-like acyl-CoA transferase